MKAKVTKEFAGRPDGEVLTRTLTEGEIIEGDLAEVAIGLGWAKPAEEASAKETNAPARTKKAGKKD